MNDRFKFRVWDKKNSEYVPEGETCDVHCLLHRDGTLDCGVAYDDGYAGGIDWVNTEDAIIEQCTGLTDKNGKLIYEGDVVKTVTGAIGEVIWMNCGFWVNFPVGYCCGVCVTQEIIGNIHEDQFREITKKVEDSVYE